MRGQRLAIQAAQLGDGLEKAVHRRVNRFAALRLPGQLILVGHLAGQQIPRLIHRLRQHIHARHCPHLRALRLGLLLQLLQHPAAGISQPLHVADAIGLQFINGGLRRLIAQLLVVGEFGRGHTCIHRVGKQRQHPARLLGQLYFLLGRQHPVEYGAHLRIQLPGIRVAL